MMPFRSELNIDDNAKNDTKINGASRNPTYKRDCIFKSSTILFVYFRIYKQTYFLLATKSNEKMSKGVFDSRHRNEFNVRDVRFVPHFFPKLVEIALIRFRIQEFPDASFPASEYLVL